MIGAFIASTSNGSPCRRCGKRISTGARVFYVGPRLDDDGRTCADCADVDLTGAVPQLTCDLCTTPTTESVCADNESGVDHCTECMACCVHCHAVMEEDALIERADAERKGER